MSSDCNAVTHVRRSDFAVRALPPHRKRPEASEYARLSTPHSTVAGLSTISVSPTVRNQAAAKLIDMHGIPDDVRDLLRRHDGILLSADAQRAGVPRSRLSRLVAGGQLERLVHGAYASTDALAELDDWQRFATRARAFGLLSAPNAYLTGWACTAIRGYPTLERPPRLPTVVRPKDVKRWPFTGIGGRVLIADVPEEHRRQGRLPIVSDEWAVVDVARTARLPDSLVVADVAVRSGLDLAGVLLHLRRWEGIGRARWVVEHAVPTVERLNCLPAGGWTSTDCAMTSSTRATILRSQSEASLPPSRSPLRGGPGADADRPAAADVRRARFGARCLGSSVSNSLMAYSSCTAARRISATCPRSSSCRPRAAGRVQQVGDPDRVRDDGQVGNLDQPAGRVSTL